MCFFLLWCGKQENKTTGNQLYICCSPWTIIAKDAAYIAGLKAILVIDVMSDNSLTLYSGSIKLAKVHVPSCAPLTSGISVSMQRLSLETAEHSRRSNSLKFVPSTPLNSSRRSSLLAHSDIGGGMLHDSVTLSPIASNPITFKSLHDAVGCNVTIKSSDGGLLRTSLPPLATSNLVKRSFVALRAALPQDAYLTVAARFFCVRNAPGPADFSPQAEWLAFRSTLLALLGFDAKTLDASVAGQTSPVQETAKKSRTNLEEGCESDWQYLLNSQYTRTMSLELNTLFAFDVAVETDTQFEVDVSNESALFVYLPHVLLVLHLLYEDLKLDTLLWAECQLLVTLLIPLASSLNLDKYCDAYWRDFPLIWNRIKLGVVTGHALENSEKLQHMVSRMETPANIHTHLLAILQRRKAVLVPYPHVKHVNGRSNDLVTMYALLYGQADSSHQVAVHEYVRDLDWVENLAKPPLAAHLALHGPSQQHRHVAVVLKMTHLKWTTTDVNSLPAGLSLPLRHALYCSQLEPATDWPDEAYLLISRRDMSKSASDATLLQTVDASSMDARPVQPKTAESRTDRKAGSSKEDTDDGMEQVTQLPIWKLLFPKDHRVQEVRRLLCSSRPVVVTLPTGQQQGLSEHELIEEREKQLLVLCIRIMALPIGRGMFTAWSTMPTVTETLTVPKSVPSTWNVFQTGFWKNI